MLCQITQFPPKLFGCFVLLLFRPEMSTAVVNIRGDVKCFSKLLISRNRFIWVGLSLNFVVAISCIAVGPNAHRKTFRIFFVVEFFLSIYLRFPHHRTTSFSYTRSLYGWNRSNHVSGLNVLVQSGRIDAKWGTGTLSESVILFDQFNNKLTASCHVLSNT